MPFKEVALNRSASTGGSYYIKLVSVFPSHNTSSNREASCAHEAQHVPGSAGVVKSVT